MSLLGSPISMKLFFISIIIIYIKLLVYQINQILYLNFHLMKMLFDNIWKENLYFICFYFSKHLLTICVGLGEMYFCMSCNSLISLFNIDIDFLMGEFSENMQYKYILSTYIKILKWVNAQFILFFLIYRLSNALQNI